MDEEKLKILLIKMCSLLYACSSLPQPMAHELQRDIEEVFEN